MLGVVLVLQSSSPDYSDILVLLFLIGVAVALIVSLIVLAKRDRKSVV